LIIGVFPKHVIGHLGHVPRARIIHWSKSVLCLFKFHPACAIALIDLVAARLIFYVF